MPITFRADRWTGNHWPSIDMMPVDEKYYLPILHYLSHHYHFPMPPVIDILDGYTSDMLIGAICATLHMDTYMFSLGCADEAVRDDVLAVLQSLPASFFDLPSSRDDEAA